MKSTKLSLFVKGRGYDAFLANHVNHLVYQVSAAKDFWKDDEWARFLITASHSDFEICQRNRRHAYLETPVAVTVHLSVVTHIYDDVWTVMLLRHPGGPIFDDTALLLCGKCNTPMDYIGDHAADLCHKASVKRIVTKQWRKCWVRISSKPPEPVFLTKSRICFPG
eukprot:GFKZ01006703.1.p1 GENE.GFKZ01006703.1~~GFKZ01006703.1.p1  ORF type:complete len:166 (+),score=3.53 GFKZ01006703.1:326-823(+)